MWHKTMFDERKVSAYKCKKKRSVAFKLCQGGPEPPDSAGGAYDAPPDPIVGWEGDSLPIPHANQRVDLAGVGAVAPNYFCL